MRKSLISIAMFATLSGFAQEKVQCTATTKAGNQCKITAWNNSTLCWRHNPNYVKKATNPTVVCSATTKSNAKMEPMEFRGKIGKTFNSSKDKKADGHDSMET